MFKIRDSENLYWVYSGGIIFLLGSSNSRRSNISQCIFHQISGPMPQRFITLDWKANLWRFVVNSCKLITAGVLQTFWFFNSRPTSTVWQSWITKPERIPKITNQMHLMESTTRSSEARFKPALYIIIVQFSKITIKRLVFTSKPVKYFCLVYMMYSFTNKERQRVPIESLWFFSKPEFHAV